MRKTLSICLLLSPDRVCIFPLTGIVIVCGFSLHFFFRDIT